MVTAKLAGPGATCPLVDEAEPAAALAASGQRVHMAGGESGWSGTYPRPMREHQYSFEMPHSAARIWALFQDYDRWTDYAPMVLRVDVLWPGDDHHNGRLRRVIFKLPLGRRGSALELVSDVEPERGYTYTMISGDPGNDQTGKIRLEPLGPNRTRFSFEERYNLTKAPFRWFEGVIYGFINRQNELSMRRASRYLTDHPEYRHDLVETGTA